MENQPQNTEKDLLSASDDRPQSGNSGTEDLLMLIKRSSPTEPHQSREQGSRL